MICDKLSRLGLYANISENFRTAMNFLANTNLAELPLGRNEVDGDNVFCNVMENQMTASNTVWEAHAEYVDIQIVISGAEVIGCTFPTDAEPTKPMDASIDAALYEGLNGYNFLLNEGEALIIFPWEPHCPGIMACEQPYTERKAVVKIKM